MKVKKILAGFATAAFIALGAGAASAEVIRVTLQLPNTHPLGVNLHAWKSCVEGRTDDLRIQIFPSAQLYKDNQVPEAVGSGAIEMGTASLTRFAGLVPAVDAIYVPFLLDSEDKVKKATAPGSRVRQIIDDAVLRESNARILWWQAFGRTIYLSKDPIRVPDDIEGKKVRTFGKLLGWTVESLGGVPTLMSGSKQFLAYQQGAVDAGITGITAVKSRKLYEVMPNMTLTFDSAIEFVAVINEDFYQSLSTKQQLIINACGLNVESDLRNSVFEIEEDTVEFLQNKMNIIELDDWERDLWYEATQDVVYRFIRNGGRTAANVIRAAKQ